MFFSFSKQLYFHVFPFSGCYMRKVFLVRILKTESHSKIFNFGRYSPQFGWPPKPQAPKDPKMERQTGCRRCAFSQITPLSLILRDLLPGYQADQYSPAPIRGQGNVGIARRFRQPRGELGRVPTFPTPYRRSPCRFPANFSYGEDSLVGAVQGHCACQGESYTQGRCSYVKCTCIGGNQIFVPGPTLARSC